MFRHTNETGDITSYHYDGDHNRVYMGTELGRLDAVNAYPDSHPLGDRMGWESQYKKEQTAIYFANDTTLSYVEPLMAISEDTNWKQNYTYGALGERISMSYLPSGDASNAWEPTPGASGANSGNVLTTLYYLSDVRGSALGLMDPEGAIAARYHYDEFGAALEDEKFDLNWAGPDNLFGYTGLGYDYSSGLNYARDRYFDANLGRFISEDTVEGDYKNPLSLNLYTYVQNNPNKYVDPSGNIPTLVILLGKVILSYSIDVMIGVGTDFLAHVNSGSTKKFDITSSLKKNAKSSLVQGLSFKKKFERGLKLADQIKKAQKAAKAKKACNCFTAGTKVLTDEGEKPIEEIEVGDKVLAKSDETGEVAYKEVVGLFRKQADEIYYVHIGNEIIEVTGEHPFWLDGKGWTFVKDLKVGDLLVSSDGSKLAIEKIEKEPREATVYNFEVADFHSYFVSNLGIWVHNCALQNIYKSIKDAPLYPQGFSAAKNGTVKNKVNNTELLDELRAIESGTWNKIYKDGVDANGKKISIHYFQSQSGQVFNVKVKNGWSNSSSKMP